MTLQELYQTIGGDYDKAISILRMEKLMDKHIRKLTKNGIVDSLLAAGETMDPVQLFDAAHAVKGNCANLGLVKLSDAASEIAEEFRPGNERKLTDQQVKDKLETVRTLYEQAAEGIRRYEEEA